MPKHNKSVSTRLSQQWTRKKNGKRPIRPKVEPYLQKGRSRRRSRKSTIRTEKTRRAFSLLSHALLLCVLQKPKLMQGLPLALGAAFLRVRNLTFDSKVLLAELDLVRQHFHHFLSCFPLFWFTSFSRVLGHHLFFCSSLCCYHTSRLVWVNRYRRLIWLCLASIVAFFLMCYFVGVFYVLVSLALCFLVLDCFHLLALWALAKLSDGSVFFALLSFCCPTWESKVILTT